MTILRPFKFEALTKHTLWGGTAIATLKGADNNDTHVGESWEISGLEGSESVVAEGDDKGLTISQLIEKYKEELVGTDVYARFGNRFPLLVKFIDAHLDLSLQVHPSTDEPEKGVLSKDELLYVVDAQPGATVSVGLQRDITAQEFDELTAKGELASVISKHEVKAGDAYLVKAGNAHGYGAGNLLVEVQKASDTTYRIDDYGRLGADGKPRELHLQQARECMNLKAYDGKCRFDASKANELVTIASIPEFRVSHVTVDDSFDMPMHEAHSFVVMVCTSGKLVITDNNGRETHISQGETVLLPANLTLVVLDGAGEVLLADIK